MPTAAWKIKFLLLLILVLFLPSPSAAVVLTVDTVWQGEVVLAEDVLVPAGVSLTIRPGTTVTVLSSETTRTEPEYVSALMEITVRGSLLVEGLPGSPVVFVLKKDTDTKSAQWAGIIVDGGRASIRGCRISGAESAVYLVEGAADIDNCDLMDNRYGVTAVGSGASIRIRSSSIADNDFGILLLRGAKLQQESVHLSNRKKNIATIPSPRPADEPSPKPPPDLPVGKVYGDQVLLGTTIWQGHIRVNGIIRVPEGARLVVMPGTLVEFSRRDTNNDGIGENGLLIQGLILAKGIPAAPIVFRSAEKIPRAADWDSINIMNSDGPQNLMEYCRIEDAYRALHFHFSNVAVTGSLLRHNYRGVQFQESSVVMRGNRFHGNKSGIQGRNSTVTMRDNIVSNNHLGVNFFRSNLQIIGNSFIGNLKEGVRLREGAAVVEENLVDGNRYGLLVADTFAGRYSRNVIGNNGETGFSLKNSDNVEFSANLVVSNGFSGMTVQDSRADIRGNQFSANGERGIGILSFNGALSDNNFLGNGLYAIDHEGKSRIDAGRNWWGCSDADSVIFDAKDDPARGRVVATEPRNRSVPFVWPLAEVSASILWSGHMVVDRRIAVTAGTTLTIDPETTVSFADGTGMTVYGRLVAKGKATGKITFTSLAKKEPGAWDEVLLEHAADSIISHAVFEYAQWGIHSHFTNLSLSDSRFRYNAGGMRFRSGPVLVTGCTFAGNGIGLRSYMGNGTIEGNDFTGNEIGIFVREKGSGIKIRRNNLHGNAGYNIRIGDFNNEDVDARENWWGTTTPAATIFDGRSEPGIGQVIYEPYLRKALPIPLLEVSR